MKKPKKGPKEKTVRVIRDSGDASKDYFLPVSEAKKLYENGQLSFDLTNQTYCEIKAK